MKPSRKTTAGWLLLLLFVTTARAKAARVSALDFEAVDVAEQTAAKTALQNAEMELAERLVVKLEK